MKTNSEIFTSLWPRLEALAVERDILDGVDIALIQTLCRRIARPGDLAFPTIIACLLKSVQAGGLRIALQPDGLARVCRDFLASLSEEDAPRMALQLAEEFTQNRLAGNYTSVLGFPPDFLPLIQSGGGLYFQKHYSAEAAVGAKLKHLLFAPDSGISQEKSEEILASVLEKLPLRLSLKPESPALVFDAGQTAALRTALRKRFTVISGGPGTGKTSLAANLLRAWTRGWPAMAHGPVTRPSLPRIRLAAPTGRAAQRLAESIQRSLQGVRYPSLGAVEVGSETATEITLDQYVANLSCETLHSLLRYNPGTGEYFYHQHRPIPADLVLIDEVSMVDIFVLARLLNALEENASLVILGDRDQLPPIDSGSVLADLIQCKNVIDHPLRNNIAILEHSHRSKAGILDVTRKINAQDGIGAMESMGTTPTPDEGCHLILPHGPGASPQEYRSDWKNCLDSWVHAHYLRQGAYGALIEKLSTFKSMEEADFKVVLTELFICLEQSRILTFTRKGWHGCVTINQTVREILLRKWDPQAALKSSDGFHGSPILILQNEYSKGLFNGDVGIFLRIQGSPFGFFRRGDDFVNFPTTFLPRYETAFAMTIHKSQGSEYDQVLLVLPESGNRLLSKETLYTAITRAKYFAGIYGSREVFLEAIANKVERESGLPDYLRGLADTEIMEPK